MTDLGIEYNLEISELSQILAGVRITRVNPGEIKSIAGKLLDIELNGDACGLSAAERNEIIKYSSTRLWAYFKHIIKHENTLPVEAAKQAILLESCYLKNALST